MMADAVVGPQGPNVLAKQEDDLPHSLVEAGGDETAGSPTASIAAVPRRKVPSPPQMMTCPSLKLH
jgi:hypothetical protein